LASVIPGPVEVSADSGARRLYALLASFMWGRVSDPVLDYERLGFRDLDELVVWLEGEYWRGLREVPFDVLYRTRPSAGERESELHYLVKAFVVRCLAERLGIDNVETERGVGNAVFDVVVKGVELVVEVETLYGTGTAVHKLVETVERAGGRRVWVVVPNPQAVIYLPLLLRVRRELRRERDVELYTLDVAGRGLVRLVDAASALARRRGAAR
jgi:hypothetical protein